MDVVDLLMQHLKQQHKWRLEDECSGGEIDESFVLLKARIVEDLLYSGCKDFSLLAKIQSFV